MGFGFGKAAERDSRILCAGASELESPRPSGSRRLREILQVALFLESPEMRKSGDRSYGVRTRFRVPRGTKEPSCRFAISCPQFPAV